MKNFVKDISFNRELKYLCWFLLFSPIDLINKGQKNLKNNLDGVIF